MGSKKKDEKPEPAPKVTERLEKFETSLKVPLTQPEILEAGERCAKAVNDLQKVEAELASIKKQFASRVEEIEYEINRSSGLVRDKFEYRPVKCHRIFDYINKVVREVRLDTSEEVHSREMTMAETQMQIELEDRNEPDSGLNEQEPE